MNMLIAFCAQYLLLFVIAGVVIAWLQCTRQMKIQFLSTIILAGILALLVAVFARSLYYDPRPFVTQHIAPLIPHAPDNGFPSDHALLTMTLTAVTYFFNKKAAAWMFVITVLVGFSRIAANVHSPLDIAAGWVIGIAASTLAYYIVHIGYQHWYAKRKTNVGLD